MRLPWLILTGSTFGVFNGYGGVGHGFRGMPPLDGPTWAQAWLRWDSGWYLRVIREGFTASNCGTVGGACEQASISFLPAYPLTVRGLMQLGASLSFASFLLNGLCLVLALWGLRRLATLTLGPDVGGRAAWAMLAFPTTLFFSAGYAEALFAAASIWAMVFVALDLALPAALMLALGTLSRPHGVVLAACVIGGALLRRRVRFTVICTVVVGACFGAYMLWQQQRFGDALAFLHARRAWGVGGPALETLHAYWHRTVTGEIFLTGWQDFIAAALLLVTAGWSFKKLGPEAALYCLLLVALPLSQGQVWGMARAVLGAFPLFLMLASLGPRWRLPALSLGLGLATLNALLFVNGQFVA